MNTADVLKIFGLEPRETRIYLALLQSGPASIRDIADRAGINRGTTHELLKRMQQKGVVSYFPKGKTTPFQCRTTAAPQRAGVEPSAAGLRSNGITGRQGDSRTQPSEAGNG